MSFRALVTSKSDAGDISSAIETLEESALPEGNVTVAVEWSGFNYKDGLCLLGQGGLVRNYPHIAGIDFAGSVLESADPRYAAGDKVVLTGWRVGEARWGGFSQKARVSGDWLVPLPQDFSTRDAMVLGTAGITAMLAINRLVENGLRPENGEVLVTGAGGGVGSLAIMLLAQMGFEPVAVSGRAKLTEVLESLGATRVLAREDFAEPERKKVLEREQWAAVIDTVAGPNFGRILKQVKYGGGVAAIGLAGGASWDASIVPFILRGVSLFGIDSVMQPLAARVAAWDKLAEFFVPDAYAAMTSELNLVDLPDAANRILAGQIKGRVVVNPNR